MHLGEGAHWRHEAEGHPRVLIIARTRLYKQRSSDSAKFAFTFASKESKYEAVKPLVEITVNAADPS